MKRILIYPKRNILVTLFLSSVLLLPSQSNAQSVGLPQSMAALGDSITAAALANYTRTDGMNPFVIFMFLDTLAKVGFDQGIKGIENPKLSWATGMGSSITSHATRLKAMARKNHLSFQAFNAAVSGDASADLAGQVDNILSWSQDNLDTAGPDYVTVEIGANDGCSRDTTMTAVADYSAAVRDAVQRLLAANKNSHILIGGIPNIEHLRGIAIDQPLGLPPLSTCQDMWKLHGFCKNMLQEDDPEKRAVIMERFSAYMHELEVITSDMNDKYQEDRVHFAAQVFDTNFNANDISIDCFHPNKIGQQILSDSTWESATWWNQSK